MSIPEQPDPNAPPSLGAEINSSTLPRPPPSSSIPPPPRSESPSPPPPQITYPPTSPSSPSRTLRSEQQQTSAVLDVNEEERSPKAAGAQPPPRPPFEDTFANAAGTEGGGSFMVEDPASPQGDHATLPSLTRTVSQEDIRHKPRPGIQPYGSMRAGTQTLIQALSAVPWTADASDDEGGGDLSRASTRSNNNKGKEKESPLGSGGGEVVPTPPPAPRRLASSLHTVYRPVALSQARSPSQSTVVHHQPPHHHHRTPRRGSEPSSSPEISSSTPLPPSHSLLSPPPTTSSSPPHSKRHRAPSSASAHSSHHSHSSELHFPFKENTVARHAQPLSSTETAYQLSAALGRNEDASVTEDAVVRGEAGMSGSSSPAGMRSRSGTGAGAGLGVGEEQRERERKASTETEAGIKRRKELAEMLREVFKLEEVEEVVGELACWLLRSVLLQGYMYLTTGHVCFYAHMPAKSENKIIKSGPLSKKSNRKIGSSTKYWFILKNAVLSWYVSSADPYFPHGNVDLQYAIDCEAVDEKTIKLTTNRRSYTFTSDTAASREEWVKAIRKVMFRTQHEGENVKIAIPLEAILDVETTSTMDFAETIEIKVVEGDEATLSFDSYFFAYFTNIDAALVQIREVLTTYRPQEQGSAPGWEKEQVYDTTMMKGGGRRGSSPAEGAVKPSGSSSLSRIGSLLHPFSSGSSKSSPTVSVAQSPRRSGEFSSGPAPIPITSARRSRDLERDSSIARLSTTPDSVRTVTPPPSTTSSSSTPNKHVSYPPSTASGPPPPGLELVHTSSTSSWAPSNFIRRPSMKIFSSGASGASSLLSSVRPTSLIGRRKGGGAGGRRKPVVVQERVENVMAGGGTDVSFSEDSTDGYASEGGARRGGGSEMGGFSMLEKSETVDREEMEADREFHEWFAMDKKELLLEHFAGFLFRVVPVSGKVFISTNHFCFKATALLYKTTMVIPIKDIIALQPQKAFRFGHHGLAVVIKGHEELFLEFSSSERRDACKSLLEQQMDQLRFKALHGPQPVSDQQQEALILQDLDTMGFSSPQRRTNKHGRHSREVSSGGGTDVGRSHSSPGSGYGSDHLPPVMFTSTESTFLDFKPKEPMHITCLTIGSRGDVQPYIALCKGLKAEGHRVRIASHGEYKDWIEGHGIEFGYVGGDPAELMRICIENGMFTVSFIKEGLNKFREWIDDLLVTSWEACQGTDLLIESPSAMGGIHIAEGLGIPYYRAFTMPWSRTRAYPHAFAVPDHHRGGSYNYMTYTMFDQVFWRAISGQINRWRKKVIGISSTNLDKLEPHKVPFLYNFSPTVVPPPLDWYEWIRITGYWFLDDPDDSANKKWSPPDGLLDFMSKARNDGKKIVYIGFGSIVVSDPDAMTACVVQSVLESDVRVILSKGWSDRLQTKKDVAPGEEPPAEETPEEKAAKEKTKIAKEREMFPAEVFPIASVPHDWLFPRIDAACHHGGAGTTGASLRAGIPTIILPFFGDQYFWADRVEVLGVGSGMKKLTQDHLTAALKTATTDEKQIRKAKALGEEIRAENGVSTAIESIYRDLEYARSLIKHPHASSSSSSSAESSPTSSPVSSPVVQTTPLPSHSRSESITPPPPGSDESWDVVTGEDQRRSSEGGSGSGSGRGGGSSRSSKVSGGLGLVGSVVNGVVGGIGGKLGIGK